MAFGDEYVERISRIWALSAPPLSADANGTSLYERFRMQYEEARRLSAENSAFFREKLQPALNSSDLLTQEQIEQFETLADNLSDFQKLELIDRVLCLKLYERLLKDAERKNDRARQIGCLEQLIQHEYHMTELVNRGETAAESELLEKYCTAGTAHIHQALKWLPMEEFRTLTLPEVRGVLRAMRLEFLFSKSAAYQPEKLHKKFELVCHALGVVRDPARRALFPDFDWEREEGFCLYYIVVIGEQYRFDDHSDPQEQAFIEQTARVFLQAVQEGRYDFMTEEEARQQLDHIRYVRKEITLEECIAAAVEVYGLRDPRRFDAKGITDNLLMAGKILESILPEAAKNEKYAAQADQIYNNAMQYALMMSNNDCQEVFLNYTLYIISSFVELPGHTTFARLCDTMVANCHPATYVHSQMVGRIAQTLCGALLDKQPELFVGICGCTSAQQVLLRRRRILQYVFECGLYHDIGKLPYLDTIGVTYRSLFPEEMEIVRLHPATGYELLHAHESTREYAYIAYGHHRWYNEQGGYPAEFKRAEAPAPLLIDVIALADCLDAATDTIFRSYNTGITLETFMREAHAGAGTRYNPVVVEALEDADVEKELRRLLSAGRDEAYRCAYELYRKQLRTAGADVPVEETQEEASHEAPQEEIDAAFERLFARLEESDEACDEMRQLVLTYLNNTKVRDEYIARFQNVAERNMYPEGRAIAYAMCFWRDYLNDVSEALKENEEGLRILKTQPDYNLTQVYYSLVNNAVMGYVIDKEYAAAFRWAMEGLQQLREHMVNFNSYYALLNNISMMLTDVELYGKARQYLEESLQAVDMMPLHNVLATRYRYAELLMSLGEYDAAEALYLEMLATAHIGGFVEPSQLHARLTVLAYRRGNSVAVRYWYQEMITSHAEMVSKLDAELSPDILRYAEAAYYAQTAQYEQADEAFTKLLAVADHSMFGMTTILRDAAEFYDGYGQTAKSHPLYIRLDELHHHNLQLVEELTSAENEMIRRGASQIAYGRLFEHMKRVSGMVQNLAACLSCEEIIHELNAELPAILPADAILLLAEHGQGTYALYPAAEGKPPVVAADDPRLPHPAHVKDRPICLSSAEARCPLMDSSVAGGGGTLLYVPLIYRGAPMGVLLIGSVQSGAFDASDRELAGSIGSGVSIALMNIKRYEGALSEANLDPLTNVANRSGFFSDIVPKAEVTDDRYALCMLDIDDFKLTNDTYGHDAGDRVLIRLADLLRQLRGDLYPARFGGEEFVLLAALHGEETPETIGRIICRKVEQTAFFDGQTKPVTVSVGVCGWRRDIPMAAQIKAADTQMYRAKHTGKNRVCALEMPKAEETDAGALV